MKQEMTRRDFIKNVSLLSGALVIGLNITSCEAKKIDPSTLKRINPNIWVTILENGDVYLVVHRSEMGQGIRTSMAAVLADELEADLKFVKIEQALGDKKYGSQNTDGSRSVRNFFTTVRKAGAAVRELMVSAAAKKWNIDASLCKAELHYVVNSSTKAKLFYGDLIEIAREMELASEPRLKKNSEFRYIGTELDNLDIDLMISGQAEYGIDATLPGMLHASIQRSPVVGGRIISFDDTETRQFPGVLDVVKIDGKDGAPVFNPMEGLAVIAENTWAAEEGKKRLKIEWNHGKNESYSSDNYREKLEKSVMKKGSPQRDEGDVYASFRKNKDHIEAMYYLPHLVHAPMETPNALANVTADKCEIWTCTQTPQAARREAAGALGWTEDKVAVHVTFLGGGFGRKSKPDYVAEAAILSQKLKKPVKVFWSREDDIKNGYYHSVSCHYHKAALDKHGNVDAWLHRGDFPPISATFNEAVRGPGRSINSGGGSMPFDIKNVRVEAGDAEAHIRIGWLRSVNNIFHGFTVESFIDELAHKRGIDPLKHHLDMIGKDRLLPYAGKDFEYNTARLKAVLKKAAENANWGKKLPKNHGMGLAVHYSFFSYVAQVVEVSMENNKLKVLNVSSVIDCGQTVNHDAIKNQMEGAAIFGLSLALFGEITAKDGVIEQGNYDDYQMARMEHAPDNISVEIMLTDNPPTGVGEPGVPPFAPALVNAIFAATGKRYRELPLSKFGIV